MSVSFFSPPATLSGIMDPFFISFTTLEKQDWEEIQESSSTNVVNNKGKKLSESLVLNYRNLAFEFRFCLAYCCMLGVKYVMDKERLIRRNYTVNKERLIRLLIAEDVITKRPGENLDDIAKECIEKLIDMRMIFEDEWGLSLSYPYHKLSIHETHKEEFIETTTISSKPSIRLCIHNRDNIIPPNFYNLGPLIQTLIMYRHDHHKLPSREFFSEAYLRSMFHELKFLRVLDLEDLRIERLPDEIGDLVHLRYLGLKNLDLEELPETLGELGNLQTLDVRGSQFLKAIPNGVVNLSQLRHLEMSKRIKDGEVRVPSGIGNMGNLRTLTGLYAGGGIGTELGNLTQLKKLGVKRFSEDHASELFQSIMKMDGLLSLSLEAETTYIGHNKGTHPHEVALLPSFESFSPPMLLQNLYLSGVLIETPYWIGLMQNLISIELTYSDLAENPISILQFLPKLERLTLSSAYNRKRLGREFCGAAGLKKLEYLCIGSRCLVEWTEIEKGALPSLKHLRFDCSKLELLPEGLQYITTLQELDVHQVHPDLKRRLKYGGKENYKIKHIRSICM